MGSILIKQALLSSSKKDILIIDNLISKIEDRIDNEADIVINGNKKAVIPGLVNMHTHSGMTLMRSCEEDVLFHEWLNRIWVIESHLDEEMLYWATKLACLEMIKSGTTCFADQYWHINQAAKCVQESGLRGLLTYVFLDAGDKEKEERQIDECLKMFEMSKLWCDRAMFGVSIHAHYTVSDKNMVWVSEFARMHNLNIHTHISETKKENDDHIAKYGISPTKRLEELGILSNKVIAAHSLWLSEEDIDILGKHSVTVVHNVNSNLKLASGYKFKYNELRDAGANMTIGTDGCGSSNNLDILEAMKTSAILQKAWRVDPSALPINELMSMATSNGAKALGLKGGKIEVGYLADLLLIDINSPAFLPNNNFEANLIYSANSSCVDTVICDGKILMKGRKVRDEEMIMDGFIREAERLLSKC